MCMCDVWYSVFLLSWFRHFTFFAKYLHHTPCITMHICESAIHILTRPYTLHTMFYWPIRQQELYFFPVVFRSFFLFAIDKNTFWSFVYYTQCNNSGKQYKWLLLLFIPVTWRFITFFLFFPLVCVYGAWLLTFIIKMYEGGKYLTSVEKLEKELADLYFVHGMR